MKKENKPKKSKERHKWLLFDKDWNLVETITFNHSYNGLDIREQLSKPNIMYLLIAIENKVSKPKMFIKVHEEVIEN